LSPLGYTLSQYLVQIIAGLGAGAILFLIASGLTLVFGALGVVNFAHGSLYMLGAYFMVALTSETDVNNLTFWLFLMAAGLGVAAVGLVMEVMFFRPIYGRPLLTQLLVTFALVLIIAGIVRKVWGAEGESTQRPSLLEGGVKFLGQSLPTYTFFFLAMAIVVAATLWAILFRTGLGRMIRAAVSDPVLLGLSGVNVRALFTGVFVLASFFAGLAGAMVTLQGYIGPDMAINSIGRAFVVVVIGGLGSLRGAFIASFLVGVTEAIGILWVPEASLAIIFALLVVVLAVRPQGIMGRQTEA
jgi:branched-chain amino acid transport system permease protein